MKRKNQILIVMFLIGSPYFLDGQVLQKQKGIVEFIFEQDSLFHKYWLKSATIQLKNRHYFLVADALDIAVKLNVKCQGKDTILAYTKKEKLEYLFDLKEFQDTTQLDDDNYHYGGDIYRFDKKTIGIVFPLTAYLVILDKKPCDDFFYGKIYKCPIEYEKSFYPMAVIIGVTKAKSLSKKEIRKRRIKRFESNSFQMGYCD